MMRILKSLYKDLCCWLGFHDWINKGTDGEYNPWWRYVSGGHLEDPYKFICKHCGKENKNENSNTSKY